MANGGIEVVGVYPVEAPEPCHLIELIVRSDGFDVGQITQEEPGVPPDSWQVAWDAKILDESGKAIVGDTWDMPERDIIPGGQTRLAFFFHYLDPSGPLLTPLGPLPLPEPSPLPERLRILEYEPPC